MRSRRPTEALAVKRSGGNQHRSMWQSAEIISYHIARERSSPELTRQAARQHPCQRNRGMTSRANSSIERRTPAWGKPPKFIQHSTSPTPRPRSSSIFSATVSGEPKATVSATSWSHVTFPSRSAMAEPGLQERVHALDLLGDEKPSQGLLVP